MSDFKDYNGTNVENKLLATTNSDGLMSKSDKTKLDDIQYKYYKPNLIANGGFTLWSHFTKTSSADGIIADCWNGKLIGNINGDYFEKYYNNGLGIANPNTTFEISQTFPRGWYLIDKAKYILSVFSWASGYNFNLTLKVSMVDQNGKETVITTKTVPKGLQYINFTTPFNDSQNLKITISGTKNTQFICIEYVKLERDDYSAYHPIPIGEEIEKCAQQDIYYSARSNWVDFATYHVYSDIVVLVPFVSHYLDDKNLWKVQRKDGEIVLVNKNGNKSLRLSSSDLKISYNSSLAVTNTFGMAIGEVGLAQLQPNAIIHLKKM